MLRPDYTIKKTIPAWNTSDTDTFQETHFMSGTLISASWKLSPSFNAAQLQ